MAKSKLNIPLIKRWVKWLRGGRYDQGRLRLCNNEGSAFCCLGVLADIQGARWKDDVDDSLFPIDPKTGRKMAKTSVAYLGTKYSGGLTADAQNALASLNDNHNSFAKIADFIEGTYLQPEA